MPPTSSVMPMVNRGRGRSRASSANTPATMPGVNSFDPRPYRPPITVGSTARSPAECASASADSTSRNSGSPSEPGSLVRSSTATRRAVAGNAASSAPVGNGRYRRTCSTPTRSPAAVEVGDGLPGGLRTRAHQHQNPLRVRVPDILHKRVPAAGARRQAGPSPPARRPGTARVERVDRLAPLEVHVGVLRGAADERPLRRQRPAAVRPDQLHGHQRAQVVVGEQSRSC